MTNETINKLFDIESIADLRNYLSEIQNVEALRENLYCRFMQYSQYRNVEEWNASVRICEALAIIGWGTHEPVEAIRGVYFNGNPETYFVNRDGKTRFFSGVWSKRKEGFAIDYGLSFFHGSADKPLAEPMRMTGTVGVPQNIPLNSQRNWIAKCPIRIVRGIANCYESSKPLVDSIEKELIPALRRDMRPELYGSAVNEIILNISFSFYDNYHCKTNYIIADESLKLKKNEFYPKLHEMYSEKEIEDNGYYLRNRFTYGPFRADTGTTRVVIAFEKEFSQLPIPEQKRLFGSYLVEAVEHVAKRLERKIDYNFGQMTSDLSSILDSWLKKARCK